MRTTPAFVAAAALASLGACQSATAIVVDVTTDVACREANAGHVSTTIAAGELASVDQRPPAATVTRCDPATGRIGSLVLVPSGAEDAEIAIRVVTAIERDPASCATAAPGSAQGCIIAVVTQRFVPHRTIELPISMEARCDGVVCPPGQTCAMSGCLPASLQTPPPQPPPQVEDAGDAHGEHGHGGDKGGGREGAS
jgi:hypothetical protein